MRAIRYTPHPIIRPLEPITKVIYSPNLDSYKVGDVINCTSDGWPKPQYKWSVKVCAGNCDDPRSGSLLEVSFI